MQIETQSGLTVFTGTAAEIIELLCGPRPAPQHDEHIKGYQWELYLQSAREAEARVRAEVRLMIAERNARYETAYRQAAE
ncbi:hypothetical protein [Bradyrhizobium sp.]|uniref:hypothetical protein n=1 Tax=Bradyrhizobium sp. TaxID=376 RepID=UPI0025BCE4D8|nr:hypothetical protein [Bradyrhizobium sp.]